MDRCIAHEHSGFVVQLAVLLIVAMLAATALAAANAMLTERSGPASLRRTSTSAQQSVLLAKPCTAAGLLNQDCRTMLRLTVQRADQADP